MLSKISRLVVNEHIEELEKGVLNNLPAFIFWKDRKGKYLGCNLALANLLGYSDASQLIGSTDYDLCWSSSATIFQENDNIVMLTDKNKVAIEPGKVADGSDTLAISYKIPLKNAQEKIIGTIGLAIPLDGDNMINLNNEMMSRQLSDSSNQSNINLHLINLLNLSARQKDCLHYLARGLTVKQIAKKLNLSPRTVGHYLENLKKKLNCANRAELMEKITQ